MNSINDLGSTTKSAPDEPVANANKFKCINLESYNDFLLKVNRWYSANEHRYMKYMSTFGKSTLTANEFLLGMHAMKTPFNNTQLRYIFKLIDWENSGTVDYTQLQTFISKSLTEKFAKEDLQRSANLERPNRWILVTFRMPTLEMPPNWVTSFRELIDLDYTGSMLRQLIGLKVHIIVTKFIVVFTDPIHYLTTVIKNSQTLEDVHFVGGPKSAPVEETLYYEFSSGSIDCPLLKNDCGLSRSKISKNNDAND